MFFFAKQHSFIPLGRELCITTRAKKVHVKKKIIFVNSFDNIMYKNK